VRRGVAIYDPIIPLVAGKAIAVSLEGFLHPTTISRLVQLSLSSSNSNGFISANRFAHAPLSRRLPTTTFPIKTRTAARKKRKRGKATGPDDERGTERSLGQAGGWTLMMSSATQDLTTSGEGVGGSIEWILLEALDANDSVS